MLCCSTIHGRIDQVNQILDLDKEEQGGARLVVFPFCNIIYIHDSFNRYSALEAWSSQINSLHATIVGRII